MRLCTIAEILDWDGQWTRELIELMLPVAWERENAQERSFTKAVFAGIAAAFSKQGWKVSEDNFKAVESKVRGLQRAIRGEATNDRAQRVERDLAALEEAFGALKSPAKPQRRVRG